MLVYSVAVRLSAPSVMKVTVSLHCCSNKQKLTFSTIAARSFGDLYPSRSANSFRSDPRESARLRNNIIQKSVHSRLKLELSSRVPAVILTGDSVFGFFLFFFGSSSLSSHKVVHGCNSRYAEELYVRTAVPNQQLLIGWDVLDSAVVNVTSELEHV